MVICPSETVIYASEEVICLSEMVICRSEKVIFDSEEVICLSEMEICDSEKDLIIIELFNPVLLQSLQFFTKIKLL
jgi:hypothetical protein